MRVGTFESLVSAGNNCSRIEAVLVSEICRDSSKSERRMIFDPLLAKGLAFKFKMNVITSALRAES
jgi:hypothetical protein